MDLSPTRFDVACDAATVDLAVLLAGVAARQAASRTAAAQAHIPRPAEQGGRFAPGDGRFNADAARALADWKDR